MKTFQVGQEVWVAALNRDGKPIEQPHKGHLMRHEPYHHPRGQHVTDGFYVYFPTQNSWESSGGWNPTTSLHHEHPGPRAPYAWEKS